MIYIWPYLAFFSWPLLYLRLLPASVRPLSFPARYPRRAIVIATISVMLVVVRYNTIVHPFTLADNRHYMFYVFRILLRYPQIKYLAVPIYFECARVALAALDGLPAERQTPQRAPNLEKRKSCPSASLNPSPVKKSKSQKNMLLHSRQELSSPTMTDMPQQNIIPPSPPGKQKEQVYGHRASFILVWLFATALSIITTALVEPRYLIVPWLIWRLHMATPRPEHDLTPTKRPDTTGRGLFSAFKAVLYERHDHRLWLETVWFLVINLTTGYIFLYWGFEWQQEPGRVQRFMW